jgi:hypothetical protein
MPSYDELDQFVDDLFRQSNEPEPEPDYGNVRADRMDQIISDAFDEVMDWHNRQISAGTDPESGLHGLPHTPWDERLDGVAAMQGACAPGDERDWKIQIGATTYTETQADMDGLFTCAAFVISVAAIAAGLWILSWLELF